MHPEAHTVLEEGRVGEVWLSSACVTAGYFNRPAVNAEVFQVSPSPSCAQVPN